MGVSGVATRIEWLCIAAVVAGLLWWAEGPFVSQHQCTSFGGGDELLYVRDANGGLVQLGKMRDYDYDSINFCTLPDDTALGVENNPERPPYFVRHPVTGRKLNVMEWPSETDRPYFILTGGYSWQCW